ncbi:MULTISPECIES: hypothetical protein [unclassified Colwellia]|uniref:hypothetical protein n=1 Tax=unclassified Colwellia TaxID=196834 RepID=UPI001C70BF27|nr:MULTISPECIES: hypothetical protein [unclassified Colwellia]
MDIQQALLKVLNTVFTQSYLYSFSKFTYPGGLWSFTFSSKKYHSVHDFDEQRVAASGLDFHYYNQALHRAAFALSNFVKKDLVGLSIMVNCYFSLYIIILYQIMMLSN